ncbi:hypothetical protein CO151_11875 [bacterium CG_4_9_14_3_um_filter_65_15]|nr:MAG: hypothetical protein CO151_11875 [bacterium CG_4_9_14_3_um_filter_65_15]
MKIWLGLLYGILVALLMIMGTWWVYYLTSETKARTESELQKLTNDRLHAAFLIQTEPQVRAEPERWLAEPFPDLIFVRGPEGSLNAQVDPEVKAAILERDRHTRRMFLSEGLFFILLLIAGTFILIHAWRSEVSYKQARELFMTAATHEFKTPLASLRLYAETLARRELKDSDRIRIQDRMIEDVIRLEDLVNDILSVSAADMFASGHGGVLDLEEECRLVLDDLAAFAAENRAVMNLEAESGTNIRGHRLPLALVLRNLLVNAVQHSPRPVNVTVKVIPGKDRHRVVVMDDGPGIPRRLQDRVFECFYTGRLDGRFSGTGLGLYLVRRNMEMLGGEVELTSEPDQGAVFTLSFPARQAD